MKAAFDFLIKEKESDKNKKIQNIPYKKLKIQNYLKAYKFSNKNTEILLKLRSRTIDLKMNFKSKYPNSTECSLNGCTEDENQEHIFKNCQPILQNLDEKYQNLNIKYEDIFGNTKKQLQAVELFKKLMEIRTKLLSKNS